MNRTPTPEEFLAQIGPDEDDEILDPLTSIAGSLHKLVTLIEKHETEEREEDHQRELVDQLDRELGEKQALIDHVLEICKPSTSKLANSIRAVLQPPTPDEETPAAEPSVEGPASQMIQPVHDADVEEWRNYARSLGHAGPDVDKANRSQIRTMLGIPHEVDGA